MATTNGNRPILDLKRWEFCTPAPASHSTGVFIASSRHHNQRQLYVSSTTVHHLYNPAEDGWTQIPSGSLGAVGAGCSGVATAVVPAVAATGGSTTTINTNLTLARDLRGYKVHVVSGPGAGETKEIISNTIGTNGIITVNSAFAAAITSSSNYRLITPRWYVLSSSTLAAGTGFKYYDFATNTWSSGLSITNLAATIGTDGKLISTPSFMSHDYVSFATGTATSGGAATLVNSAKTWTTNQWTNYQVRIVSGTGAGQIRTIASNDGTTLTVSSNWATNPDNTSVYSIEGNDDFIYYLGNNAVTLYRYSISNNTWTVLSPGVARAGAPAAGMSGNWIWEVTDSDWSNESSIRNGRYIYSYRGGGSTALDRYDIALNSWSALTYAPATETFTTGSKHTYCGNYIYSQKDVTGRWFKFDVVTHEQNGWTTMLYPQSGTAAVGDCVFDVVYKDGATEIDYIYIILHLSNIMLRQMVI